MKKILGWVLNRLEKYDSIYKNAQTKIFAFLVFVLLCALASLIFFVYFINQEVYEMVIYNFIAFFVFLYSLYLILFKYNFVKAQYIYIIYFCIYFITSTYFLGYEKCTYILFYPLIFALYSISPTKRIHLHIATLINIIAFIILIVVRFIVEPKYGDRFLFVEYFNIFLAIFGAVCITQSIAFYDKVIEEYKENQIKNLRKEIYTDFLTGLYNKRYISDLLLTKFNFKNAFIVLCNLDNLKEINDVYGKDIGDYILKDFSNILKSFFREEKDIIVRWSGDDFLVIVNDIYVGTLSTKLNMIQEKMNTEGIVFENNVYNLTMTVGIKNVETLISFEENLKHAYLAIDYGKQNGKKQLVYFQEIINYTD